MIEDIYNLLLKDIQSKIGKEILYNKDCIQLSNQIAKETHRQISSSTLKRLFGIIKTNFNPSKYTLETLVLFLGFKDWPEYLNCYDDSKFFESNSNTWEILKKKTLMITEHSIKSLKLKTGFSSDKLISRSFVESHFTDFETSSKTATMFIAPDGYGKSTLLIQLLEKYFLGKNSEFKNDIVTLIDGGIFFNLYTLNPEIELLNQFLKFKISSSFGYFFQKNPKKRKGRIWIVIDNVDEIFFDKESYHQLAENLVRIIMANNNGWYKMILTCRPENVDVFNYLIGKNPLLKLSWHGVNFNEQNLINTTNIPLFDTSEIKEILNKLRFKYDYNYLKNNHKDVIEVIKHPYLLSLFAEEFKQNEKISEIILFNNYIERRLYTPPYKEEKLGIIDDFIEICNWGKESNTVRKDQLLLKTTSAAAYRELISYGLIYEYVIPEGFIRRSTFVKFNQSIIFEYLLFEKWRARESLNSRLFFKIRDFYQDNIQIRCNLIRFLTQVLIYEEKIDVIRELHNELERIITFSSISDIPPCILTFSSVIKKAIRTNVSLKKGVTPWLFRSKLGVLYHAT